MTLTHVPAWLPQILINASGAGYPRLLKICLGLATVVLINASGAGYPRLLKIHSGLLLLLYSRTMTTKVSFNYFPIRVISECSFSHRLDCMTMDRNNNTRYHRLCHLISYLNPMQIQSFWTINSAYLNGACLTKMAERALPAPVAPDGCFFLRIHISFSLCITSRSPNCCDFEEEGRRHRIAFNSLYLFSFKSIIYEANGEELYNFTRGATVSRISNQCPASTVSVFSWFVCAR